MSAMATSVTAEAAQPTAIPFGVEATSCPGTVSGSSPPPESSMTRSALGAEILVTTSTRAAAFASPATG